MEHKNNTENAPYPPPHQPFRSPGGLDVDPIPPDTVRVSKRAAILGIGVLCALAGAFGFGVYQRQNQNAKTSLAASDSRKIAPATVAAREITKDIPTGVVNLSDEKQLARTGAVPEATATAAGVVHTTSAAAKPPSAERPSSPSVQPIPSYHEPSPEEKQAALMAERRLQAQLAPTGTGGVGSRTVLPVREAPGARSPEGPPLAEFARALLKPNASPSTSPNDGGEDAGLQGRKEAFLSRARAPSSEQYLKSMRTAPLSPYEIKVGWEIPAVMEQGLNSDLPGELKALVASNVYDSASGRFLLIPQGSRIIGTYDSVVAYGQSGVQVVWNRIIFPDGSSIDLAGMVGQDAQGFSGFRDKVDNHYKRLIATTVLSSIFSAGFQLSQSRHGSILQTPGTGEIAASAVGREVSQLGAQISRKNLHVQPTIKIPVGYRFNVRVNRDILFGSPYRAE